MKANTAIISLSLLLGGNRRAWATANTRDYAGHRRLDLTLRKAGKILAMPILNVMCPDKLRPFSTGIEIAEEKKDSLPNRTTFSQCPYCKIVHGWTPDAAFFGDGKTAMLD